MPCELNVYGLTTATVRLAVGLPLTWVSQQLEDYTAYLTRSREVIDDTIIDFLEHFS